MDLFTSMVLGERIKKVEDDLTCHHYTEWKSLEFYSELFSDNGVLSPILF